MRLIAGTDRAGTSPGSIGVKSTKLAIVPLGAPGQKNLELLSAKLREVKRLIAHTERRPLATCCTLVRGT